MYKQIIDSYSKVKRTALLAQDNITKNWYHLFSVIELLPNEIPEYNIPTEIWCENKIVRANSSSGKDNYSFYLMVHDVNSVDNAISNFENPLQNNVFDGKENLFFNKAFVKEPTGDVPYVTSSNIHSSEGLMSILPKRNSSAFILTQIDSERKVQTLFQKELSSKEQNAISQLTNDWLGFDIATKAEHLGNIYLYAANPYYRDVDISLSTSPTGIFYHFKMRKEIEPNFTLRIIDTHGDIVALDKIFKIQDSLGLIQLPHEPNQIELRIYNENGDLIGLDGPNAFIRTIQVGMSMKSADFHVSVQTDKGSKDFTVEKFSKESPMTIGDKIDFNPANYFKDAENQRKHISHEKNKNFIFFPGSKSEMEKTDLKTKSKEIIRDIINQAQDTCFLIDPYFNVNDLIDYAFYIKSTGVNLRILNCKEFITKEQAAHLQKAIDEYNNKPFQKIECKMLKGTSILHDRFIIADKNVWYLGASFSEFGSRATCLGKVPESSNQQIIREIEKWYFNDEYSQLLKKHAENNG